MKLYQQWIYRRERGLTLRDQNRRILPFQWGLEWLQNGVLSEDPLSYLEAYAKQALSDSESFYRPPPLGNYTLRNDLLTFPTPASSAYSVNNTTYSRVFSARDSDRAVIVVPQWNANSASHVGLCRVLQKLGITAVRLTLPYHEQRLPQKMDRAEYMVSPNLGRTLHATQQAVLEVRQLVQWLRLRGYRRIGVMGTSIGSCVCYLAFVHEPMINTGVFNHVAAFFADVVWVGLATRYVRWGLEGHITIEELRRCWAPISPWHFVHRLKVEPRPHLMITTKYDLTFPCELSSEVFRQYDHYDVEVDRVNLPCGHYTMATFPFKYLDGWHICRYLLRRFSRRSD